MLKGKNLFTKYDKVESAILRIKDHVERVPAKAILAFSGGKDSMVIHELAKMAGLKIPSFYNAVGIDPPELVSFIKEHYPDVEFKRPKVPFFAKMLQKGFPPSRVARYCCEHLKEYHGDGLVITGVRWAESKRRSTRRIFEKCIRVKKGITRFFLCPIIDWSHEDVWEFIKQRNLPYCSLYDEGFHRLGCVLCPMTNNKQRQREALRWPKMANAWKVAMGRLIARRVELGREPFRAANTAQGLFDWYIGVNLVPERIKDDDQQCFKFE